MSDLATKWIADHAAQPGMLGCGVGEPGGTCLCQSASETLCPPDRLERILRQIIGAKPMPAAAVEPRWHTWVFAHGKIRSITRPDGWTLVAVAGADAAAAQTLDTLATEFLAIASEA
jgi:hypothetical protein